MNILESLEKKVFESADAIQRDPLAFVPPWLKDSDPAALKARPCILFGYDPKGWPDHVQLLINAGFKPISVVEDRHVGDSCTNLPVISSWSLPQLLKRHPNAWAMNIVADHPRYLMQYDKIARDLNINTASAYQFQMYAQRHDIPVSFTVNSDYIGLQTARTLNQQFVLKEFLTETDSLSTFYHVLLARLTGKASHFWSCYYNYDELYLPKFMMLNEQENFIDAGAYDGSDSLRFARKTQFRFNSCRIFELNPLHKEKIESQLSPYQGTSLGAKTELHLKGLWSKKGSFPLAGEDLISCVNEVAGSGIALKDDAIMAEVVALDDVCDNATVIKLEIEGAERDALIGAKMNIQKNRAKMAVSLYHRADDFKVIPEYLRELQVKYDFKLRHHTGTCSYTVLYCL